MNLLLYVRALTINLFNKIIMGELKTTKPIKLDLYVINELLSNKNNIFPEFITHTFEAFKNDESDIL